MKFIINIGFPLNLYPNRIFNKKIIQQTYEYYEKAYKNKFNIRITQMDLQE